MGRKKKRRGKSKKRRTRRYPMTIRIDLDKDGRPDVIRVYNRKKGSETVKVANVKFGTTEMGSKKKRGK